jgi:hypothetical protein
MPMHMIHKEFFPLIKIKADELWKKRGGMAMDSAAHPEYISRSDSIAHKNQSVSTSHKEIV